MGTYDKDKNDRTRVKKRSRTLVSKANELAKVPGVNIYLLITYPRANIVYKSLNEASWPPSDRNLEGHYRDLKRENPQSMQAPSYDPDLQFLKRLLEYFATRAEFLRQVEAQLDTSSIT